MKGRKLMFEIKEFVPASQIWPTAEDHIDMGEIPGLVRGYNIEVVKNGKADWMSAEWIWGDPVAVFNDDYHTWSRQDWGFTTTGRICFRGYGVEEYDPEERDYFIIPCTAEMLAQIQERGKELEN